MRELKVLDCTLDASELSVRVEEWRRLSSHATSRTLEGTSLISTYPNTQEIIRELRRLIAAEGECCTFMRFDVDERPDAVTVRLTVPEEKADFLSQMSGASADAQA